MVPISFHFSTRDRYFDSVLFNAFHLNLPDRVRPRRLPHPAERHRPHNAPGQPGNAPHHQPAARPHARPLDRQLRLDRTVGPVRPLAARGSVRAVRVFAGRPNVPQRAASVRFALPDGPVWGVRGDVLRVGTVRGAAGPAARAHHYVRREDYGERDGGEVFVGEFVGGRWRRAEGGILRESAVDSGQYSGEPGEEDVPVFGAEVRLIVLN